MFSSGLQSNELPARLLAVGVAHGAPLAPSIEKLLKVDGKLRLARQRVVHFALHLQGNRKSHPEFALLSYERDFFRKMEGLFTRYPDSCTRK